MRWIRPTLLVVLMVGLFLTTSWFAYTKVLGIDVYLATWSPTLNLMVGYFFGERSNAKRQGDLA